MHYLYEQTENSHLLQTATNCSSKGNPANFFKSLLPLLLFDSESSIGTVGRPFTRSFTAHDCSGGGSRLVQKQKLTLQPLARVALLVPFSIRQAERIVVVVCHRISPTTSCHLRRLSSVMALVTASARDATTAPKQLPPSDGTSSRSVAYPEQRTKEQKLVRRSMPRCAATAATGGGAARRAPGQRINSIFLHMF